VLIYASIYCSLAALLCVSLALLLYFDFRHRKRLGALHHLDLFPRKWVVRILAAAALIILAFGSAVRVSDRFFQYRAETLLRDIRALELRKSTWQDAERVHAKYAKWATTSAPCSAAHCDLTINLDHWYNFKNSFEHTHGWGAKYVAAREFVGGRWAHVWVTVRTRGDKVWGTDFAVIAPDRGSYSVVALSETLRDFGGFMFWGRRGSVRLHPNLLMRSHKLLAAYLTPYASSADRQMALAFDLSCLGGTLRRCEPNQLLPAAAAPSSQPEEYLAYEKELGDFVWTPADMLRINGRDAKSIAIVEVSRIFPQEQDPGGNAVQRVNYQVVEVLKGTFQNLLQPATYYLTGTRNAGNAGLGPPAPHQRLIAFWGEEGDVQSPTIAPVSEQNLQQVRAGMVEDQVDIPTRP
jgi:hypothetical protein